MTRQTQLFIEYLLFCVVVILLLYPTFWIKSLFTEEQMLGLDGILLWFCLAASVRLVMKKIVISLKGESHLF